MKRRYVLVGLAVVAALAIVTPVFGLSSSIKKAIRKEVSKQLAGKTGPQGPAGANGTNGTARAYGYMDKFFCQGTLPKTCTATDPKSSNVTSIQQVSTGVYCATVTGLSPASTPAVATVDVDESFPGNASNAVQWSSLNSVACPAPKFEFHTFDPADPDANVDTSFSFVIP